MEAENRSPFDRQAQYTARRRAVLREAGAAFRKRGYHNTPMTKIAEKLGLTKTALYYYVKSKDEILLECHLMIYDAMDALIRASRSQAGTGLDILKSLYGEFTRLLTRDGMALLADVDSLDGEDRAQVSHRRDRIERAVTRIMHQGMEDGSIRPMDAGVAVFFLMGALNWLNVWYEPGGRMDGDRIAEQFVRQLAGGLAAGRGAPALNAG